MSAEPLRTVREIAGLIQMSERWVRQQVNAADGPPMPHFRMGKALRFRLSEVEAWMEEQLRGRGKAVA